MQGCGCLFVCECFERAKRAGKCCNNETKQTLCVGGQARRPWGGVGVLVDIGGGRKDGEAGGSAPARSRARSTRAWGPRRPLRRRPMALARAKGPLSGASRGREGAQAGVRMGGGRRRGAGLSLSVSPPPFCARAGSRGASRAPHTRRPACTQVGTPRPPLCGPFGRARARKTGCRFRARPPSFQGWRDRRGGGRAGRRRRRRRASKNDPRHPPSLAGAAPQARA